MHDDIAVGAHEIVEALGPWAAGDFDNARAAMKDLDDETARLKLWIYHEHIENQTNAMFVEHFDNLHRLLEGAMRLARDAIETISHDRGIPKQRVLKDFGDVYEDC